MPVFRTTCFALENFWAKIFLAVRKWRNHKHERSYAEIKIVCVLCECVHICVYFCVYDCVCVRVCVNLVPSVCSSLS